MPQIITERADQPLHPRVQTLNDQESMTVQSDRSRADIAEIIKRYAGTGIVDRMAEVDLQFRDVTEFEDFADLMQQTKAAELAFMELPSKLREVFDHDVSKWLDAAHDPEKIEALRPALEELGILEPVPEVEREGAAEKTAEKEAPPTPPKGSVDGY